MKKLILSFFLGSLLSAGINAQARIDVEVLSNMFTPSAITIDVGDTVVWTNFGGTHNVNGSTATFSGNPVSFGSGAAAPAGWVYSFKFNVAGTYDYQCDPHAGIGMTGTITVVPPSSIIETDFIDNAVVYPNPFSNNLTIKLDKDLLKENSNIEFVLYDLLGSKVRTVNRVNSEFTELNTEDLSDGIYIYAFKSGDKTLKTGKLTNN